jgi:cyclophilin family peptidyl-prolyl cis-trans isomerase
VLLDGFSRRPNWQSRLYAARAAVILGDVQVLTRLAQDEDDNVVEAALPVLREKGGSTTDPIVAAALARKTRTVGRHLVRPYQAVLAAATALQGAQPTAPLIGALADALERITEERCETSRDVRLALIARLSEMGSPEQAGVLAPLLTDIDPVVAAAAGAAVSKWTGRPAIVDPPERAAVPAPAEGAAASAAVTIEMESGGRFQLRFFSEAPYAAARFLQLARGGYYDGLAFQRVVPNFVIQGGGPNANEYCGDCPFARDEVGLVAHRRGTVGISTRGRDTGDSQIFVNLVDSPRLDHTYTVFAYVCSGMGAVESIQEGERMKRLTVGKAEDACKPEAN